jgi:SnoaL-like domain
MTAPSALAAIGSGSEMRIPVYSAVDHQPGDLVVAESAPRPRTKRKRCARFSPVTPAPGDGSVMSLSNVQIVQASFEAWNAGDMRAWGNFLAPDVIWRPTEDWPEPGPYVGRESVLREAQQLREAWGADAAEPVGEFSHSGNRVVGRFIWVGGRGQGPDANTK